MSDSEIVPVDKAIAPEPLPEPTPSDLEREIEETRERLAGTIDALLYRASPKTMVGRQVALAKGYFVDVRTGEPRTENILKAAGALVVAVAVVVVLRRVTR